MNQLSKIELQVEPATAAALADPNRREAVTRLVERLVHPQANDPLTALLEHTAAEAAAPTPTQTDSETQQATHKAAPPPPTPQRIRLTRESNHQTIHIPQAFELPGTEATITQQDGRLIIEPIRKRGLAVLLDSWEDLDEDFPEIADPPPEPVDIS